MAPTYRPSRRAIGRQRWRDLLFIHWPVDVADLRPLVPGWLDIDVFDGQAYVSHVPFTMIGARPALVPERLGLDFVEINLRTYVHRGGTDPGIYMLSIDAGSWLVVKAARLALGLPYFHARMSMQRDKEREKLVISCRSQRKSGSRPRFWTRCSAEQVLGHAAPGTLEHFLIERYLLHGEHGGIRYTGQIHHPSYTVWTAHIEECHDELMAAAGLPAPRGQAPLAHYSPGVDVEVFAPRKR